MHEADRGLSVQFFLKPRENPRRTKEEGRPIFDEIEMVSIAYPGNKTTQMTAPALKVHYNANIKAQQTYAERFPEQYRQFKDGIAEQVSGTPIHVLGLSTAENAELAASKIKTVEQLANMPDANIRKMGPSFRSRVDHAKAYLETATGATAMRDEMAALRAELEALRAQNPAPAPAPEVDPFAGMEDEDLRNMLTDAGVDVDGRWGRKRMLDELAKLREAA